MPDSPSYQARVSPSEIIGKMAGEYRLGGLLGEGGFGAVYEAEHPLLKRRAAVKVLHRVADRDSDAVQRFISEAQAVNQIRSRHIIDIFSFGALPDGRHFYVMDFLEGEPLDRYLKRVGRVDVATTLQLLQPIADALDLAHGAGIIHRDLKPQNIFLSWDKTDEVIPKLLDFGMAKLLSSSPVRTVSGTPIGTPLYMAPEQARGDKVDAHCDIYALGILCYEMLTGQLPFDAETTVAVLMAHLIQTPEAPSEVATGLSPVFDGPLLKMLEKAPSARPSSAGAALSALREAAEQAGVSVPPGPPRLPRPAPSLPPEPERAMSATLLAQPATPQRATESAVAATARAESATRRLWPFAALLMASVAGLTFWLGTTHVPVAAPASSTKLVAAQPPVSEISSAQRLNSAAAASTPVAPPSAAIEALPSAAAMTKRPKAGALDPKSKKRSGPPGSPSATPEDLESPFGP